MLKRLRAELEGIRRQKHKSFGDFQHLIKRIKNAYGPLFPKFSENIKGSHYVYNFGIEGHYPFTVVREHGGRDHQSPKTAARAIEAIEDILDFIDINIPDEQESASKGELGDDGNDDSEAPRALPEPEVPDGSGEGG